MLGRSLLVLIALAAAELVLLGFIANVVGGGVVFAGVALSAIAGITLMRREGAKAVGAWRLATARGELPGAELASGALMLLAGALLVVPGVLTDLVGLTLLLPGARRLAGRAVQRGFEKRFAQIGIATVTGHATTASPGTGSGAIIDLDADAVRDADSTAHANTDTDPPPDSAPEAPFALPRERRP